MTAPMTENRITAAELRAEFETIHREIASLREQLATMRDGINLASEASTQTAEGLARMAEALRDMLTKPSASAPATSNPPAETRDFTADEIVMTYDDKGQPAYKAKGFPFAQFGVRVWPEVLKRICDPSKLKPGPNAYGRVLRVAMKESTTTPGKMIPDKVIGLGAVAAAPDDDERPF